MKVVREPFQSGRALPPIVLLIGPPGAGKGAQARRLVTRYQYVYVGTGHQLREEIRHRSRLGRRVAPYVAGGRLVPTAIVAGEIATVLRDHTQAIGRRGAVFDGYPRTVRQAKDLLRLLARGGFHNRVLTVHLRTTDAVSVARLLDRGRADDTPTVIRRRLREFRRGAVPLLRYLRARTDVIDVDATRSVSAVGRAVRAGLSSSHRPCVEANRRVARGGRCAPP